MTTTSQVPSPAQDFCIIANWHTYPHINFILSRDADKDAEKLRTHKDSVLIDMRIHPIQPNNSLYLPDLVSLHREYLDNYLDDLRIPYSDEHYMTFNGVEYPLDLTTIEGPWKTPLSNFTNLVVLEIDAQSATYWLIPIIMAAKKNRVLRRIIIRDIEVLVRNQPWPIPWRQLDLILAKLPFVHLILHCPSEKVEVEATTLLPLTTYYKRLWFQTLTEDLDDSFEPLKDPVGSRSIYQKLDIDGNKKEILVPIPGLKRKRE